MKKLAACACLALALWCGGGNVTAAADSRGLIAIDVLLLPDATMVRRALAINHLLLQDSAWGFALDATHVPHMTLLQCYVRADDLGKVSAAVEGVLHREPPAGMDLMATGMFASRVADISATGISVRVTPALQRLQRDIVAAVTPFIRHGGTAGAFVGTPKGETIDWTIAYVDNFPAKSSWPNYSPHVTAGAGNPNFVARMKAAPFTEFAFKIEGAAIYQLGDIGTARRQLWVWQP